MLCTYELSIEYSLLEKLIRFFFTIKNLNEFPASIEQRIFSLQMPLSDGITL